ncbi:hypothetical protein FQR65_LT08771 [Abscondita terminalis]|nr:hypothetical protein FQR65_LT08771 [Abscondita terminalis]
MEEDKPSGSSNMPKKNGVTEKLKDKFTNAVVRYVPRPLTIWRGFTKKRRQRQRSINIDKHLKKDHHWYWGVLILGRRDSGKTAICHQMKILYGEEFSETEKQHITNTIDSNVKEGVLFIANKIFEMGKFNSEFELRDPVQFIENYNFELDNRQKFYFCVEMFWNNPQVQDRVQSLDETQLVARTKHFVNKIIVLKCQDYVPTSEDILRCYEPSQAVVEIKFKCERFYYKITEISNIAYEKRLWVQIANEIFIIIFVIPINTFFELKNKYSNPLRDALNELEQFGQNFWITPKIRCIIFLNKVDLFTKHILKVSVSSLERCLPGFSEYKSIPGECLVTKVKNFILYEFTKVADANKTWRSYYIYFTCAVDSEDIGRVYAQCLSTIQKSFLCNCSLI